MPKRAAFISLGMFNLDRSSPSPLHRQVYDTLRQEISAGQLKPGVRLPPTRALAQELGVSRNTITSAYNQLLTEGYLESKTGSGTRVTSTLPEALLQVDSDSHLMRRERTSELRKPRLSEHGNAIADIPYIWEQSRPQAFDSALPAVDEFPRKLWEKLLVAGWRQLSSHDLGYQSALGYEPLREALTTYLQAARGVRCSAEQIIITNGAQQAINIAANLLLNKGTAAWVENPCYPGIQSALRGVLADIIPVPVDEDGLVVEEGIRRAPNARLAYISPSHQYPLGVTMSLTRRLQLLQWADEHKAWIVEDDYDSEFRYAGYPLTSVQGQDQVGRVIYVGTFSKVLFPALRTGYMVVPPDLVDAAHAARAHADRGASVLEQAVLARFIEEGHLARHVRQMRTLYNERQQVFVDAAQQHLGGLLDVKPTDAGLHLVGWLPKGSDDKMISAELNQHGIVTPALSSYALEPLDRSGLVIGFTAVPAKDIPSAVRRMRGVLEKSLQKKS